MGAANVMRNTYDVISLPYKCHCEAFFAKAISCFTISIQKGIATPPKSKSGGSQ